MEQETPLITTSFYKPGSVVLVQDSKNEGFFFIVKSGRLRIESGFSFKEKELSRFEAGDTFGLVSALTAGKFLGNIVAETPCELIKVPVSKLGEYLKGRKSLVIKMIKAYSHELRILDKYLADINHSEEWEGHPAQLFEDAAFYIQHNEDLKAIRALQAFVQWAANEEHYDEKIKEAKDILSEKMNAEILLPERDRIVELKDKDVIFVENEPSSEFFIVKDGYVKLSKILQGNEFIISIIGVGEIFGEMAVLENNCRLASAEAFGNCSLMRLTAENFTDNIGEKILQRIFESLARRIWLGHQRLSILKLPEPVARLYVLLEILLQERKIRTGEDEKKEIKFNFNLGDLQKMCGLIKIKRSTVQIFIDDKNIEVSDHEILIHKKDLLDDKVIGFRNKMRRQKLEIIF